MQLSCKKAAHNKHFALTTSGRWKAIKSLGAPVFLMYRVKDDDKIFCMIWVPIMGQMKPFYRLALTHGPALGTSSNLS